jgi:hypothetical protein
VSDFVTECPACGAQLVAIAQTQVGPNPDLNTKPVEMKCIGETTHTFPVLERDDTVGGQPRYRLGNQSDAR